MTLDTFLEITATRVPTVQEMIALADELNIKFKVKDNGQTVMVPCQECRDETLVLAKLFRREPFRSEVIAAKLPNANVSQSLPLPPPLPETKPEEPPKEQLQPPIDQELDKEEPKKKVAPPPGAMVFIADDKSYMNEHRKGPPYMWTWEGATTWYYVKDHPPPPQYTNSAKNSESTIPQ